MACFGLKLGQDLGNRATHPYRSTPPPSYPGTLPNILPARLTKRLAAFHRLSNIQSIWLSHKLRMSVQCKVTDYDWRCHSRLKH